MEKFRKPWYFPEGKERKKELFDAKEKIKEDIGDKLKSVHYRWNDSPLEKVKGIPHGETFQETFQELLPDNEKSLGAYLERLLADKKGKAIGIEFGGTGNNLFKGFTPNFFEKTVGITLFDDREEKSENNVDHIVLIADLLDKDDTYKNLDFLLEHKKVDLIIERLEKGFEYIPKDPFITSSILNIWFKMLNKNGIMLVQSHPVFNNLLEKWGNMIKENFSAELDFKYAIWGKDGAKNSTFFLQKKDDSLKNLPLLSARQTKDISKNLPYSGIYR